MTRFGAYRASAETYYCAYILARDADVVKASIPIVHGNGSLLWSLVFDHDSWERGVVFKRSKRDQERMGAIILAVDDELGLDDGVVGSFAQGTNPELCR